MRRLTGLATVIPLSEQIVNASVDIQRRFELEPQDAIVFASVDQFLRAHGEDTAVFANRNARDFETRDVKAHFQQCDCQLLTNFSGAAQFIKKRVWLH